MRTATLWWYLYEFTVSPETDLDQLARMMAEAQELPGGAWLPFVDRDGNECVVKIRGDIPCLLRRPGD